MRGFSVTAAFSYLAFTANADEVSLRHPQDLAPSNSYKVQDGRVAHIPSSSAQMLQHEYNVLSSGRVAHPISHDGGDAADSIPRSGRVAHPLKLMNSFSNGSVSPVVGSGRVAHVPITREAVGGENHSSSHTANMLDGAIIPAKSGRVAHNDDGDEIGAGGIVQKENLGFFGRLMAAIHLGGEEIPTAQPTPHQPEYLRSEKLYVKSTEPSFLEKIVDVLSFGSDAEEEAPQAYMDGISKPNWSLDRSN